MRRRDFVMGLAGAASLWPVSGNAQPAARAHVGFLSANDERAAAPFLSAIRTGFAAYGYVEPGTLTLDTVYANDVRERIPALVSDLERRGVQAIVTHAAATPAVVRSERTVPVVYEFSADPVVTGIATDLAHPLYNATGVTLMRAELNGKRLEMLHEIEPGLRKVVVIANPLHAGEELERADLEAKARQLGIDVAFYLTPNKDALERALAGVETNLPQALIALPEAFVVENRARIIGFAANHRIPVISGWSMMAKAGALYTYGPRLIESYRRTAYFVDRILKGTNVADLPIERPTVLELILNLKTAKTLGIVLPPTLIARADEVLE